MAYKNPTQIDMGLAYREMRPTTNYLSTIVQFVIVVPFVFWAILREWYAHKSMQT
jgi:hypothetical protein